MTYTPPSLPNPNSSEHSGDAKHPDDTDTKNVDILTFTEDSPFFQNKLAKNQTKIEMLSKRVKKMQAAAASFCTVVKNLGEASETLAGHLNQDWSELEADVYEMEVQAEKDSGISETPVSLAGSMGLLGTMLSTISDISTILTQALDFLLVQALNTYREENVYKQFRGSRKLMEAAEERFHHKLASHLNTKTHDAGTGNSGLPRDLQVNNEHNSFSQVTCRYVLITIFLALVLFCLLI